MNYYINADTGNNSTGNGTSGNPWLTIAKAVSSSSTGDTINLQTAVATYPYSSWDGRNLVGAGISNSIVDCGGSATVMTYATDTSMSNLTFQNVAGTPYIFVTQANSITFTATNIKFTNIQLDISNESQTGIWRNRAGNGTAYTGGTCVITACVFNDITGSGSATHGGIFKVANASWAYQVINCTIYINTGGVNTLPDVFHSYDGGTATALIKNTIVLNTSGNTVSLFTTQFSGAFTKSGSNNAYYTNISNQYLGGNDVTADPKLVDPANGNFNLRPSSPCKNTGI